MNKSKFLVYLGLTVLTACILIQQCHSQITFSTDWYGGKKRSSPINGVWKDPDYDAELSALNDEESFLLEALLKDRQSREIDYQTKMNKLRRLFTKLAARSDHANI